MLYDIGYGSSDFGYVGSNTGYGGDVVSGDTVVFGEDINLSDFNFTWGSESFSPFNDGNVYLFQTLNIGWQTDSIIKLVMPRPDAYNWFNTGVEFFEFADGNQVTMEQILALAGPSPQHAPILNSPLADQHVFANIAFSYTLPDAAFIDLDAGDILAYESSSTWRNWLSFDPETRTFTGMPGTDVLGLHTIFVTATDRFGASVSDSFSLTVSSALVGTAGDDVLQGTQGDDVMVGGAGDDLLAAGAGQDTYVINLGDGRDTIVDAVGENNTISFGPGITQAEITLRLGSLMLDLGNGDEVHIEGFNPDDVFNSSSVDRFTFFDGTVLNIEELLARGFDLLGSQTADVIKGTNVNDRISGDAEDDTLIGGYGNDSIEGGAGNDIIIGVNNLDLIYPTLSAADIMVGNLGSDRFVLGDLDSQGYDDQDVTSNGVGDYALIKSFSREEDVLQLHGTASQYLQQINGEHIRIFIDKPGNEPDELIAIVEQQNGLALGAQSFLFLNDSDGDGVPDYQDNAIFVANPDQRDTDGDGYGNIVDADLNQSGMVDAADLGLFIQRYGSVNPDADFNGDGRVGLSDLSLFKGLFGSAPGPSYLNYYNKSAPIAVELVTMPIGLGEIDTMVGSAGRDTFVLGDLNWLGYDDRDTRSNGVTDYALIKDFARGEDLLQLQGVASDYLQQIVDQDIYLYSDKANDEPDELIAIVAGQNGLSLDAQSFRFVKDTDGDGILDSEDNAILVANPDQRDTDGDGYGNIVDPDFNNDQIVNFADLAYMVQKFFSTDDHADLDGNGFVNVGDLAILQSMFFQSPGLSYIDLNDALEVLPSPNPPIEIIGMADEFTVV